MAKIGDFSDPIENKNIVEDHEDVLELKEEVIRMMDDPIFEFALENLEWIYNYIEEEGYALESMVNQVNGLKRWEERRE